MKTVYLRNGETVLLHNKLDTGEYVIEKMYVYSDCEDNEDAEPCGVKEVVKEVFSKPPIEKKHEEVVKLQFEIEKLQNERNEISKIKQKEKELLAEIKNRDFVQGLVDYLNGDFKYVLYVENMEIMEKDRVYISPFIKITNTRGNGFSLYILRNEDCDSYDDRAIMVFKTIEDAREHAKKELINKLKYNTEKANYKWGSKSINDWFDRIHRTCNLKNDTNINKIYNEKFEQTKQKEDEDRRIKLQKEIEERQNALNTIS